MKDWNLLYSHVVFMLQKQLSPLLTYHHWKHTVQVTKMSEQIAKAEQCKEHECLLIKTAALFHDIGFITCLSAGHEEASIRIAEFELPAFGYTKEEIAIIAGMIRATMIPQLPKTKLEAILADADLEYLGTENFKHIGDKLLVELNNLGAHLTDEKWNEMQIKFLESHQYHTNFCLQNRVSGKENNLRKLIQQRSFAEK